MLTAPSLFLGTALWGWQLTKTEAFALLETYYTAGYRGIDTASNYPINHHPADFHLAENWLAEWCQAHQVQDLKIIVKLGATDNMGGTTPNLSTSFLLMSADHCQRLFGTNLWCLMLHWDPRTTENSIARTLIACQIWQQNGWQIGLSGIVAPEIYAALAPELLNQWWIETKYNLLDPNAYTQYQPFHGKQRFIAYGLNAGGLAPNKHYNNTNSAVLRAKNISTDLSPYANYLAQLPPEMPVRPSDFNQLNMLHAYSNPDINGMIIGPRNLGQLQNSLAYYGQLPVQSKTVLASYLHDLPLSLSQA